MESIHLYALDFMVYISNNNTRRDIVASQEIPYVPLRRASHYTVGTASLMS